MGLLWLLLVIIVVVSAAYATLRGLRRRRVRRSDVSRPPGSASTEGELPREALDHRYADGDLSDDEYERTRTDLS
jgi:uncharacterized membrane protein